MSTNRTCDGVKRRDFLKAGALGGVGLLASGMTLGGYLRMAQAGTLAPGAKAKSAILIDLGGGPSHVDSFDPKPEAPDEIRGEFKTIDTCVSGLKISEHLPKLAQCADKFALLRGVSHNIAAHDLGTKYMTTGNRPIPSLAFPGYGCVVSKELSGQKDLPQFVAIPNTPQRAGYLGVRYAPLETNSMPAFGRPFTVRGLTIGRGVTLTDVEKREHLLGDLDTAFRGFESQNELVEGLDEFSQQAYQIITSPKAREAFDISKEPEGVAKQFGEHAFGQSCLLACRLVESGVRFATVTYGGWDTHTNNFATLKDKKLPELDQGLSALFSVLAERRLLESTAVFVTGEFGRTPKINQRGGRDHWPRAMFVLMAGGGMKGGQVIGASDEKGMGPAGEGITPDNVAASFYYSLGIDHKKEYRTSGGRPLMIVRYGEPIPQLFA